MVSGIVRSRFSEDLALTVYSSAATLLWRYPMLKAMYSPMHTVNAAMERGTAEELGKSISKAICRRELEPAHCIDELLL